MPLSLRPGLALLGSFTLVSVALGDSSTLRVATWNVSQYRGTDRAADIQNAVYGSYQGRSMSPDVIMAQEIQAPDPRQANNPGYVSPVNAFLAVLNGTTTGPKDWAASYGTITGTDAATRANDQVVFYRTSKVSIPTAPTLLLAETSTTGAARQVFRWDVKLANDASDETLSLYDNHLKAGSDDNARRKVATDAIRADANGLPAGYLPLFGGDMNVQSAKQSAYQSLVGSQANDRGRFFDPIGTPGDWNDRAFRFVHTQAPGGNAAQTGGMDDRHDQILLGGGFDDGKGLEYVGQFGKAYRTDTWDDPDHSYRVWGNDGTSFDRSLTVTGNAMVGPSIAQSLANVAFDGGHLPVFLDLRYTTNPVPEPASLAALGLGALAIVRRRRKG